MWTLLALIVGWLGACIEATAWNQRYAPRPLQMLYAGVQATTNGTHGSICPFTSHHSRTSNDASGAHTGIDTWNTLHAPHLLSRNCTFIISVCLFVQKYPARMNVSVNALSFKVHTHLQAIPYGHSRWMESGWRQWRWYRWHQTGTLTWLRGHPCVWISVCDSGCVSTGLTPQCWSVSCWESQSKSMNSLSP
jgi:hypothetical protein